MDLDSEDAPDVKPFSAIFENITLRKSFKSDMVVHTFNPGGKSKQVPSSDQPSLYGKFQVSLNYTGRPFLKTSNSDNKRKFFSL